MILQQYSELSFTEVGFKENLIRMGFLNTQRTNWQPIQSAAITQFVAICKELIGQRF